MVNRVLHLKSLPVLRQALSLGPLENALSCFLGRHTSLLLVTAGSVTHNCTTSRLATTPVFLTNVLHVSMPGIVLLSHNNLQPPIFESCIQKLEAKQPTHPVLEPWLTLSNPNTFTVNHHHTSILNALRGRMSEAWRIC